MQMKPRRTPEAIAIVTVLAVILAACGGAGGGSLQANVDPEREIVGFHDFTQGPDKSFGIFICANGGEVILESVEVIGQEGAVELLGGVVYEATEDFVGALDGFPPTGQLAGVATDINGAIVTTDCEDPEPAKRTQLLIGVERTGSGGGMIDGVRVGYRGGELEVADYTIILCGDQLEYCEAFAP